jgi:CBS domain-containing protein
MNRITRRRPIVGRYTFEEVALAARNSGMPLESLRHDVTPVGRDVITVTPDTTIVEAARLMLENKIGGIPVLDGDYLVGIITESDIFRTVVQHFAPTP